MSKGSIFGCLSIGFPKDNGEYFIYKYSTKRNIIYLIYKYLTHEI